MISVHDCLGLCDLSEGEILAIAAHEHIPEIIAIEYAQYLIDSPDGKPRLKAIIVDDLRVAEMRGDKRQVDSLQMVFRHFTARHWDEA